MKNTQGFASKAKRPLVLEFGTTVLIVCTFGGYPIVRSRVIASVPVIKQWVASQTDSSAQKDRPVVKQLGKPLGCLGNTPGK